MAISFAQSERSTLGVEWELQLIDIDSEDLRQCAQAIITQVCAQYPGNTLVHGEMLRNTVELVSRKQTRVRDAIADLNEGLEMLEPITSALRVDLTSAGGFRLKTLCRIGQSHPVLGSPNADFWHACSRWD